MSVKSEWRLLELLDLADNPFDSVILSTGLSVDLTGNDEELFAGLKQSLAMEARLFDRGVTCELKDGGQDCLECPMYVADREEEPRAPLCRLGRDQRIIEERYQLARRAPFEELAEFADEMSEFAHVESDDELLVAAGL